jgi:SAM-dependent methyltransferase
MDCRFSSAFFWERPHLPRDGFGTRPSACYHDADEEMTSLDSQNSGYWETLCGTTMARALGISDRSPSSITAFDNWYFRYYPYLERYIGFEDVRDKAVLEVGLGYGSVAQRLAACAGRYTGIDIAHGPAEMVRHRLRLNRLPGEAVRASILQAPFPDESFDAIIAIGSYHHTGDTQRALDESWRLLRGGGRLSLMVYNGLSYRRWLLEPIVACRQFLGRDAVTTKIAKLYDNVDGKPPPHTDMFSRRRLAAMLQKFREVQMTLENFDRHIPRTAVRLDWVIRTPLPHLLGLDIYAIATK